MLNGYLISNVKQKSRPPSGLLWWISSQSAAWVEAHGGFLIEIGSAEPKLPHWQFRALRKFFYRISIIRAVGGRGPGSDTTARTSVTNERICTGQRPLCSLTCSYAIFIIVMPFWANTIAYKASTRKHELLVNSMVSLKFVAFRMTSGWFTKSRQLHGAR